MIADQKHFAMVDVGGKAVTERIATARGSLRMGAEAFELVKRGALPKGDALKLAEVAGIQAAKRTYELIPLCHPLALDKVEIAFELDPALPGVNASCTAKASAKTGVEMEALTGVTAALLSIYDLVKQVDPALTISNVRLEEKRGGKSGIWRHPENAPVAKPAALPSISGRAAAVTVSDRCSRGEAEDKSGPLLAEGLRGFGLAVETAVVSDDRALIVNKIRELAKHCDAVILTGGTGLSPRDVTPEAVESVCERLIPGIGEALRLAGMASTPRSSLSRSAAGQLGKCLVVALPGSTGGVRDGLKVLEGILPHALHISRGGAH